MHLYIYIYIITNTWEYGHVCSWQNDIKSVRGISVMNFCPNSNAL